MTVAAPWRAVQIAEATAGRLVAGKPEQRFNGIAIDSRTIKADDIFVAIRGETHDGHAFIADIISRGIKGAVVSQLLLKKLPVDQWQASGIVCIAVDETTAALGKLAAYHRRRAHASVVAITGSNGKTTTRKMTAAVLASKFNTLATKGNFNNEIGMPLTLLNLKPEHQWSVVELGMNHPGEIARLTAICQPDIGVITNIGPAHLEGVGSIEGVRDAKGELLEVMSSKATAVLNADNPYSVQLAEGCRQPTVRFGQTKDAQVRAESIDMQLEQTEFQLVLPSATFKLCLKTPGIFMVQNALAAAAVGFLAGLTADNIKAGLESFQPVHGRLNFHKLANDLTLIDDSYNANPESVQGAIQTLVALKQRHRGICVLGDMLELGAHADYLHRHIGSTVAQQSIDRLYVTGNFADAMAAGAREGGMAANNIIVGSKAELVNALVGELQSHDWILVKGSRGMRMETIVEEIINWLEPSNKPSAP